jgi:hypothetical protein
MFKNIKIIAELFKADYYWSVLKPLAMQPVSLQFLQQ